ncbi:ABC transporter ATP-binding protein [Oceanotoga sp. DSM 15011]|jgi:peptide/nickel transport system ATP-binding protein|uniref:Peptide/nickel transport system ATP-binding protein n=1 Tax=Oceanotoga teriensis TaxID=515440 RepID=A0AA45HID5_9BACT|nr:MULTISPECIES: ABC transporter ATP-binding protein [Oceanotoga]MDN5342033.1 hypothetical protein [Oceanotoga sp.]PWJ92047.1 peptide/nickel transport system ATP-binding protein [Oceanotoga teriensis]UYO98998.1 ABC transporter ATP-binding protein [Oceanotoga sp. DSM 15011]
MSFPTIIQFKNIQKTFTIRKGIKSYKLYALRDINLEVKEGEVISLVGESGSGKTTLLRLIARIYTETDGEIYYKNKKLPKKINGKKNLEYRRDVQMIFQDPFSSLNPIKKIYSILKRPLKIHKFDNTENRVIKALEEVELTPIDSYINKYPHELSGGQRQRVVIARSIITRPTIILADEPTSMLDVSIRAGIMNLLLKIREDLNTTYIHVTHDLAAARYISDRIAVMYAGMIMEIGNADEIVLNPLHPYTQLLKKAAPNPDKLEQEELGDTGELPDTINIPKGCPFYDRCPKKMDICNKKIPEVYNIKERQVRCFLYKKEV